MFVMFIWGTERETILKPHNFYNLKLFPFKVQILQAQTQANKTERYDFDQMINDPQRPQLLYCLLYRDEAHLHWSGYANKQNFRF